MSKENDITKMTVFKFDSKSALPSDIEVEIEIVKFNKDYSKLYFDDNDGTYQNLTKPKGLRQGPQWVEEEIIKIREIGEPDANDIFNILAWKLGKIDYKNSKEKTKTIKYVSNWVIGKSIQTSTKPLSWDKYTSYANEIINIWSDYRNKVINVDVTWKKLVKLATETHKDDMKGIGPVILVTLLFFITKGELPIYDRFAMSSLVIWKLNQQGIPTPTGTIIRNCGLPSKDHKEELLGLLDRGKYAKYIQLLKNFCSNVYGKEDIWKKERYVDQALFVYGHFYDARYSK